MMYYRRKILLSLLEVFGGKLSNLDLQKYLFLATRSQGKASYDFVPYKFGCFSYQSYADIRALKKYKIIDENDHELIKSDSVSYLKQLSADDRQIVYEVNQKYGGLRGPKLIEYVYKNYPYYAINSEIADQYLSKDVLENERNNSVDSCLFTIGYENKSIEHYMNQLIQHNVKVLCDVRRNPISMKYGFSKNQLKSITENMHIKYMHFPALGIASDNRQALETQEDYDELFKQYKKTLSLSNESLSPLYNMVKEEKRIALTCFESNYKQCHRTVLAEELLSIASPKFELIYI